ncbi:MAG TPA: Rne/Rng family ribonuclease [Acidimicrobiia bacterium]|nr:Rne/Rng family ribonuclease [Acidimicrobiia bacterium]
MTTGPLNVSLPGRPGPAGENAGPAPAPTAGEKPAPGADDNAAAPSGRQRAGSGSGARGERAGGAPAPSGGRARSAAASASASLEISASAAADPAADARASRSTTGDEDGATTGRRRRSRGRGRGGSGGDGGAAGGAAAAATTTASPARSRGRGTAAAADKARQSEVEAMLDELDEAAIERRKGRTRKGRPTGRYLMCVSVRHGVATQVAVLEGRSLVEHYVSRPTDTTQQIDGNIYLGKVQNVLPGMEAAFVDIGTPKNGVLYRDDVVFDETEIEGRRPKIERLLRNGQSVVVQVTKNPIGTKGARLTQEVSLAGRFVVMIPNQPGTYGISKRLSDDERKRLRKILDEIRPAENGLIVRTAADGASADELARDLRRLSAQWEDISKRAAKNRPALLLHQEPDLAIRVIREEFNKEYRGVVIDDPALYEEIRRYVEAITPELADRVELYSDPLPIFERYHVHEQLHKALERKVWLPSGGSIIIERTEALTVIDVNTAKNVGRSNLEETVFANNLEAAEEVARQLRLRDIGGIIVIDFIDMEIKKNREEVLRKFKEALARDKTRTQVFDISELGLVEMTRKRISEGLVEAFSTTCTVCEGRGIILDDTLL